MLPVLQTTVQKPNAIEFCKLEIISLFSLNTRSALLVSFSRFSSLFYIVTLVEQAAIVAFRTIGSVCSIVDAEGLV